MFSDEFFMRKALEEASQADSSEDVPIGAVIVLNKKVIARAHNQVELLKDPTAHAEMVVITEAVGFLGKKWLEGCSLYVTVEPCSMCAGALVLSRIDRVVYGVSDPKAGAAGSVINVLSNNKLNHRIDVTAGVLGPQCAALLQGFFRKQRAKTN